ncbi:MAG: type II toxin-antitoxin system VapC family toxin [Candidatus Dormibacteraeota bacterium]|nr:type II toxin-antitoxin system VapC family toxin [Candidatus Dormibacteraeota bacterium]
MSGRHTGRGRLGSVAAAIRYAYLDTSAFVKLCWPEPETVALTAYLQSWPLRVSSALLLTEALRAAQGQPVPRVTRVQSALRRIALIDVDRALFRQAGLLLPPQLRSLDSIHLAAAYSLGPDLGVVVAYDQRMLTAAQQQGLPVASPI